jgi:hypothetical protein
MIALLLAGVEAEASKHNSTVEAKIFCVCIVEGFWRDRDERLLTKPNPLDVCLAAASVAVDAASWEGHCKQSAIRM